MPPFPLSGGRSFPKVWEFPPLSPDSTILPGGFTLHTANRLTPMNFMFDHGGPLAWKFQLLPFSAQGKEPFTLAQPQELKSCFRHPGPSSAWQWNGCFEAFHHEEPQYRRVVFRVVSQQLETKDQRSKVRGLKCFKQCWMANIKHQPFGTHTPNSILPWRCSSGMLPSPSQVTASLSFHEDSSKVSGSMFGPWPVVWGTHTESPETKKHGDFCIQHKLQVYTSVYIYIYTYLNIDIHTYYMYINIYICETIWISMKDTWPWNVSNPDTHMPNHAFFVSVLMDVGNKLLSKPQCQGSSRHQGSSFPGITCLWLT